MSKNVPHCQGKHLFTCQARRTHMTSMTHPSVDIQTSPLSVPALPQWFGEVSLVAQYLTHLGTLEAISQRVRLARGRMGTYDVIDFMAVLIGYALSGERTLQTFYERLQPFASPFMALFGREQLPHRSSLSRFLASLDHSTVEALRTLFLEDLVARQLGGGEQRGLWDRCGEQWHVFDVDGTRAVARQRALPHSPDLPAPKRRREEVCSPGYCGHQRYPSFLSHGVRRAWHMPLFIDVQVSHLTDVMHLACSQQVTEFASVRAESLRDLFAFRLIEGGSCVHENGLFVPFERKTAKA